MVQLSTLGEREKDPKLLTHAATRVLGPIDIFIPAVSSKAREELHTEFYMEGYIFVAYCEGVNYMRLQDVPFFKTVICDPAARRSPIPYQLLDDSLLAPMRTGMQAMQLRVIKTKDRVRVTKGTYKNLTGVVTQVRDGGEIVQMNTNLSSKPMLIDFPVSFLEKI